MCFKPKEAFLTKTQQALYLQERMHLFLIKANPNIAGTYLIVSELSI